MAITTPVAADALPPAPSTAEPASFDAKADAFLGALDDFRLQENSLSTVNYNNALDAQASATASNASAGESSTFASQASASAVAAASSAGAPLWASGTTYALGAAVWSPTNRLIYRRMWLALVPLIQVQMLQIGLRLAHLLCRL